jgi:hypothetical protein
MIAVLNPRCVQLWINAVSVASVSWIWLDFLGYHPYNSPSMFRIRLTSAWVLITAKYVTQICMIKSGSIWLQVFNILKCLFRIWEGELSL